MYLLKNNLIDHFQGFLSFLTMQMHEHVKLRFNFYMFLSRYGEVLFSLMSERFGYLLVSIEREVELENMMPHSVSFNDAVQHFGNICTHLIIIKRGPGKAGELPR